MNKGTQRQTNGETNIQIKRRKDKQTYTSDVTTQYKNDERKSKS